MERFRIEEVVEWRNLKLCWVGGERGFEGWEKESLKDFDCRAKEGDWVVGGGKVGGFARFEEGNDGGLFPNGGVVGMGNGEVEK